MPTGSKFEFPGLSKDYLREVYRYDGLIDEEFLKTRVWWWKLLDTFRDDYERGHGPFIEWISRLAANFPDKEIFAEEEFQDEEGEIEIAPFAPPVNWKDVCFHRLITVHYHTKYNYLDIESVFRYELLARAQGSYPFGRNWLELSQDDANSGYFDNIDFLAESDPRIFGSELGTVEVKNLWLDLEKSDAKLIKQFRGLILKLRRERGIAKPRPNQGKRNRGYAWSGLGAIDIKTHPLRALDDDERSNLSKLRRRYVEIAKGDEARF